MNEIRRHDRDAEEIARIREIVGRHALPDFVTGFDVRLGEFDGDPAMWITFRTRGGDELATGELRARARVLNSLSHDVQADLLSEFDHRFPYFRTEKAAEAET